MKIKANKIKCIPFKAIPHLDIYVCATISNLNPNPNLKPIPLDLRRATGIILIKCVASTANSMPNYVRSYSMQSTRFGLDNDRSIFFFFFIYFRPKKTEINALATEKNAVFFEFKKDKMIKMPWKILTKRKIA